MKRTFLDLLIWVGIVTKDSVYYSGGSEVLPPPLKGADEQNALQALERGEEEAKQQLIRAGYEPEVYTETKFKTVTQIEKLVGKSAFDAIFSPFVTQGEGALTLVPESDKRTEFTSGEADFSDMTTN